MSSQMLDISRVSNLARIKKCGMIMGRQDDGNLTAAQILYPIMQCTDIFYLKADICQLGVDQRKVVVEFYELQLILHSLLDPADHLGIIPISVEDSFPGAQFLLHFGIS